MAEPKDNRAITNQARMDQSERREAEAPHSDVVNASRHGRESGRISFRDMALALLAAVIFAFPAGWCVDQFMHHGGASLINSRGGADVIDPVYRRPAPPPLVEVLFA